MCDLRHAAGAPDGAKERSRPGSGREREGAFFDGIAGAHCRKDLTRSSRIARRWRLEQTVRGAGLSSETSILEIGCGAGFAASYLAGRFGRYCGVDSSAELIGLASRLNAAPGVRFVAADVRELETEERFDVVLLIGVLHHLPDLVATARHIARLLKSGGTLVANEPQRANPLVNAARRVRTALDRTYSAEQVQFSAPDIRDLLEAAGLTDITIIPQGLFSTPFAELAFGPQWLTAFLAAMACRLDRALERRQTPGLMSVTWNLVARARRVVL